VGSAGNYALVSSTPTALVVSGMANGLDNDWNWSQTATINSYFAPYGQNYMPPTNNAANNSIVKQTSASTYALGHGLLLNTVSGTPPSPLAALTTYYMTGITPSGFQLALTSTGAVAGNVINITTTTQIGGGSFTLTPVSLSGTFIWGLQISNDGSNFTPLYVTTGAVTTPFISSQTFSGSGAGFTMTTDLGNIYYKWLRLAYVTATRGAINLKAQILGKKIAK
jgi:hypothetical protein